MLLDIIDEEEEYPSWYPPLSPVSPFSGEEGKGYHDVLIPS